MNTQQFRNLKDLFQQKYGVQMKTAKQQSISEVLHQLKKTKEVSPAPRTNLREEIVNFSRAVAVQNKSKSKEKTPVSVNKYSLAQPPKSHSRNNSSQSRNTSSHSINDNSMSQTNRSQIKDIKRIPVYPVKPKEPNNQMIVNLLKQQQQPIEKKEQDEELLVDDYNGVTKNNFVNHYVIGKGGFGKVWRVELKKTRMQYAMKEMLKSKIIAKRSINSVMNEKSLLSQLRHPYLVNMSYAFQDRDTLYLIMDLLTGGDLRFHIGKMRKFKENQTKFFVVCILLGLEYLHDRNIIHRDIKPENIVLDKRGYARITDLGIARQVRPENAADTSGTPGYMAPEVICRQNHGIAVDYFALGVIAYEFMMGKRPYQGKSRKEIRDQILAKQAQVKEVPPGWSMEGVDFVNRLLQRKPVNRLGYNGPSEVKGHPWLKGVQWDKMMNKQIEPCFVPTNVDDMYRQQGEDDDSQDEQLQENQLLLRKNSVQNLFAGYSYDCNADPAHKVTRSTISTHNTSQVEYMKL